jgi:Tfp pilus assembly protein PilE
MKLFLHPLPVRHRQGVTLIECLLYIAVLGVLLNVAIIGFNRCWDNSKHLRRNAEDIVRALKAGEQWRADIRAATGAIQITELKATEQAVIPQHGGNVTYTVSYPLGEVRRQAGANGPATLVLSRLKSSLMQADPRALVTAWRWEVELVSIQKKPGITPLFTFEAVPTQPSAP